MTIGRSALWLRSGRSCHWFYGKRSNCEASRLLPLQGTICHRYAGWAMQRIGQAIRHWLAILAGSAVAFGIFASNQLQAQQVMTASSYQQDTTASSENTGQDFTSPENLFQLRYQYKTAPGTGSVKGTIRTVTTDTLYLRSDFTFDISALGFHIRSWLAVEGGIPERSTLCCQRPDLFGSSIGRLPLRYGRCGFSSSAHRTNQRALGCRRWASYYCAHRSGQHHEWQMADDANCRRAHDAAGTERRQLFRRPCALRPQLRRRSHEKEH